MTYRLLTRTVSIGSLLLIVALSLANPLLGAAYSPGNGAFNGTWSRTDRPVLDGITARTWMWGPEANSQMMSEPYAESPGDSRQVQYFDKARMEITQPGGDSGSIWYVTNGLLVVELITGKMQVGDNSFEARNPASVNVAGDFDDPTGPTYATFGSLLDEAPRSVGSLVGERVDRQGNVTNDPALAAQGVDIAYVDNVTNHAIARPFWNFMNSSGTVYQNGQYINQQLFEDAFFATGRPIAEAYWAEVKVGGAYRDVLMQCFERRCLTYTPGNPQGFIVEAGNVGQHYYEWRYGDGQDNDGDNGNGNDGDETPVETATRYDFLTKFGLPRDGHTIDKPNDVATAPNGDVYITDTVDRQILRFDRHGVFITAWGSEGTGNGQFTNPRGITVDDDGFVYVADKGADRIQKFDSNGAFVLTFGTTGAGNGELSSPHDVAAGPSGRIYVSDQGNNRVQVFNANGGYLRQWGTEGAGPDQLKGPHGINASDSGLIYVADSGNKRVQVFDANGVLQGSLGSAGNGDGQFGNAMSVAIAANGTVYVADPKEDRISVFSVLPVVATGASTLQSVQYQFSGYVEGAFVDPTGLDVDENGRLIVAHRGMNQVQVFAADNVTILGGPLKLVDTWVDDSRNRFSPGKPRSVWVGHDAKIYATDGTAGQVKVYSEDGEFLTQLGPIVNNDLLAVELKKPADVTTDADGFVYIADATLNKIVKLDDRGNLVAQFGVAGTAPGQFQEPIAVALDEDGNIYVADSTNRRIQKFSSDFTFLDIWYSELHQGTEVDIPIDLAVGHGRVYVTFAGANSRVEYFDLDGEYLGSFDGFTSIGGIAIDTDGSVFVGDGLGQIQKFTADGEYIAKFGRLGTGDGEFTIFTAIRVALEADGNVYATDSGGQRIQVFEPVR